MNHYHMPNQFIEQKKGAEMAMEFHKNEKYKEHLETEETWKFGEHESWFVDSREILD